MVISPLNKERGVVLIHTWFHDFQFLVWAVVKKSVLVADKYGRGCILFMVDGRKRETQKDRGQDTVSEDTLLVISVFLLGSNTNFLEPSTIAPSGRFDTFNSHIFNEEGVSHVS